MIQSCTTYTKFTVYGNPGTEILTPDGTKLATIDNTGRAKIKNNDDVYHAFLLSHQPGSDVNVPFALDYQKKSYKGWWYTIYSAFALFGAGAAASSSDKDLGGLLMTGGLSVGMIGGYGLMFSNSLKREYHYKYLAAQQTNQDIQFTRPNLVPVKTQKTSVSSSSNTTGSSTSTKKISSSKSSKTLKDNAAKIEGTYIGSGSLKSGNEVIEDYADIKVVITKKSKDVVLVNVFESDGSKFFTSDGEYTIKKLSNGKYLLSLKGISNATIEIDTRNNLVYLHPRVNIDNDIYTLSIKASCN